MSESTPFRFRVPFESPRPPLAELLARARAVDSETAAEAVEAGRVRVDGRVEPDPRRRPDAGAVIEGRLSPPEGRWGLSNASALARGDDWVVADKPAGMPGRSIGRDAMSPIEFLADTLGVDRRGFTPVWPIPDAAAGPWLFGTTRRAAERLREAWRNGDLMTTWVALTPEPEIPGGVFEVEAPATIQYSATELRDGLAELQLTPRPDGAAGSVSHPPRLVREALAGHHLPPLGDAERGGYMIEGPLRLRLAALFQPDTPLQHSWPPGDGWWPAGPVIPASQRIDRSPEATTAGELTVSSETLRSLQSGPLRRLRAGSVRDIDADLAPGDLLQTRSPDGIVGPFAIRDGRDGVAAWRWGDRTESGADLQSDVETRFDRAVGARRQFLRRLDRSELFRLIHGAADGFPGLFVDRAGPVWRVECRSELGEALFERIESRFREFDPSAALVRSGPVCGGSRADNAASIGGSEAVRGSDRVPVRELGGRWTFDRELTEIEFAQVVRRPLRRAVASMASGGERWLLLAADAGGTALAAASTGAEVAAPWLTRRAADWVGDQTHREDLERVGPSGDEQAGSQWPTDSPFDGIVLDRRAAPSSGDQAVADAIDRVRSLAAPGAVLVTYRCHPHPDYAAAEADQPPRDWGSTSSTSDPITVGDDIPTLRDPQLPPPLTATVFDLD